MDVVGDLEEANPMEKKLSREPVRASDTAGSGLPFRQAVRCGDSIFVSAQSAIDNSAPDTVVHAGDMAKQAQLAMEKLKKEIVELGGTMDDVVKLNTYMVGREGWKESAEIQGEYFTGGTAYSAVVVPALSHPDLLIQVDAVAILSGERTYSDPDDCYKLPADVPFHQGVRAGTRIYVSGQVSATPEGDLIHPDDMPAQTRVALERIQAVLKELGASMNDVVKTNVYYGRVDTFKDSVELRSDFFTEGPTSTGVAVPVWIRPDFLLQMDAAAIVDTPRVYVDPPSGTTVSRAGMKAPMREGVRCGNMIYVMGQESMDEHGGFLFPGDLPRQTSRTMENIDAILHLLGATMDDVVKLNNYFVTPDGWSESLAESARFLKGGAAVTNIRIDDHMSLEPLIESDVIAMVDE
jgi:enamine deaminase RidA (YjgF/YER057c/UK114 family)